MTEAPTTSPTVAPTTGPQIFPQPLAAGYMRYVFIGGAFGVVFGLVIYSWVRGARIDRQVKIDLGETFDSDGEDSDPEDEAVSSPRIAIAHADESHGSPRNLHDGPVK